MANISQIKLPNGTTYDVKDNSGEKSVHNHELASIVPITSKTYASSSYYATSSGSWEAASWYFMSVKPDTWDKPWKIRIRVHSFCPGYSNVESYTDALITGRRDGVAYSNYTERLDTAHYYIPYYTLKKAGFDAGLGHAIGVSILYGTGYTTAAYYRTFEVDFYESENCTVTFFDTPVKWSSWTNGNTTNYNSLGSLDAVTRGYTESGDRNDVNYQNRIYYTYKKPYATLYRYQILLSRADSTLLPVNSVDNAPSNISKTLTTEEFDPFGEIYYYNSSTTRTTSQNLDNNVLYRQILADLRYAFNITNESGKCLTGSQPVYIVAIPQSNGMAKLASPALVQALPSTEDGKIYIYIGQAYPDTYPYRTELPLYHPVYWYKNGAIRPYGGDAVTVTGKTPLFTHQDISGKADKATTLAGYGITDAKIASGVITLGSNTITPLTSSSTLSASKLSGAIPSAVTATTQASTDNSTKIATTAYVTTAIANLPEPMLFKGSVGTGGTITSLPTAAATNEGWTYKVITALSSPAAKVGDTVISNGSSWVVIPSGDEPSGTVTSVAAGAGLNTTSNDTATDGGTITSSGTLYLTKSGVTAGSYGDSAAQTPGYGSTFKVPYVTVDKYGRVTSISDHTVKIPASDNTNTTYTLTNALASHKFTWTLTPSSGSATTTTAELVQGTGITLTDDTTNKKITIANGGVTGVKGDSESSYRTGQVNLTASGIGAAASDHAHSVTITPTTTEIHSMTSAGSVTAGTANVPTVIDTSKFSGGSFTRGAFSGGSFTQGTDSFTQNTPTVINTSKFSGGSFTRGTFSQGTLPTLTMAMDTTDTKKLKITFGQGTLPTHAADSFTAAAFQSGFYTAGTKATFTQGTDSFTAATHAADSFTAAKLNSGFYTAGTANTPTAVTLPGRGSAVNAWTGYSSATANANT